MPLNQVGHKKQPVRIIAPITQDSNGADCVAVCGETAPAPSVGGVITKVTITSSSWTPLPAVPTLGRVGVSIQNESSVLMRVNYTVLAPADEGALLTSGGERFYDFDDNIIIYGRLTSGADQDIMVEEIA